MDDEETKNCPNCKREIPVVNFTIHTVHCARNIKVCPVCKEPVPGAELDDHHKKLHKLLPCKQCGESVCGSDLEDHIRDSCANTIKTCRFCELELPRREVPAHEGYCGARTERCPQCQEYVMVKYRQLHLDSNHGFLRLDDDPVPVKQEPTYRPSPRVAPPPATTPLARPTSFNEANNFSNGFVRNANNASNLAANTNFTRNSPSNVAGNTNFARDSTGNGADSSNDTANAIATRNPASNVARNTNFARTDAASASSHFVDSASDFPRNASSNIVRNATSNAGSSQDSRVSNGVKKRTNDQPQINTNTGATKKVDKVMAVSRGAVKKRPAPAPPRPGAEPLRDLPYYSALRRAQHEERAREEQNAYNLAHGLPPVLSPAAKIDKLRKLDALQNFDPDEHNERIRREEKRREERIREEMKRQEEIRLEEIRRNELRNKNRRDELQRDNRREERGDDSRRDENRRDEPRLDEFKALKPMSPEQFASRLSALRLAPADRFTEIKSSLRDLRRGLNEVTAPYNNNNNTNNNNDLDREEEVRLPCEFCDELVSADDLVQHQTGCRPDLAQYWGAGLPAAPGPASPGPASPGPASPERPQPPLPPPSPEPVIPCEFCARSLPVYLITEHQERCAREVDILAAD